MKRHLLATALLLATAGAAAAQTLVPCDDIRATPDISGECAAAPVQTPAPTIPDAATQNTPGIDRNATSAIPQPAAPEGMPPLVVPNDPLGQGISRDPLGSPTGGEGGNSGVSSPAIR